MEEGKRDTMENQPDMAGSLHTKRHTWILVVALVILILIIGGYTLYGGSKSPKTLTYASPFPTQSLKSSTGTLQPTQDSNKGGLAPYPDEPLDSIPTAPVSVKFLVEHRTALNGKTVTVRGFVVSALLGKAACPGPPIMACGQPSIRLADIIGETRDKNYDIRVRVSEAEKDYSVGQVAEVKGTVASSKIAVYLEKTY